MVYMQKPFSVSGLCLFLTSGLRSKQQRVIHLVNMGIAESTVSKLLAILEKEGSAELLGGILKQASHCQLKKFIRFDAQPFSLFLDLKT